MRIARGPVSALISLCVPLFLVACAVGSYAGISFAAGAADPELQSIARRAAGGDKQAQLDLGIRYEEGRGVERDPAMARRLYRRSLDGAGFQTQFVPAAGGVAPENTAIGEPPLWPRSIADISGYGPTRIPALLRLCGLAPGAGDDRACDRAELDLLVDLVRLETNFRACRIRANLGDAGANPYSFIFNAVDTERRFRTRQCIFDEPAGTLSAEQARLVWSLWLGIKQTRRCAEASRCELDDVWTLFDRATAAPAEDSLAFLAMREAIEVSPPVEPQVGTSWWHIMCGSLDGGPLTARHSEQQVCRTIAALHLNETR
ncbi:MAG TPA: hypothetical protein VN231_14945 [Allosphingosinicella sp.]|nr:hypothetical protein [Allosphingosinicella sp.]